MYVCMCMWTEYVDAAPAKYVWSADLQAAATFPSITRVVLCFKAHSEADILEEKTRMLLIFVEMCILSRIKRSILNTMKMITEHFETCLE